MSLNKYQFMVNSTKYRVRLLKRLVQVSFLSFFFITILLRRLKVQVIANASQQAYGQPKPVFLNFIFGKKFQTYKKVIRISTIKTTSLTQRHLFPSLLYYLDAHFHCFSFNIGCSLGSCMAVSGHVSLRFFTSGT